MAGSSGHLRPISPTTAWIALASVAGSYLAIRSGVADPYDEAVGRRSARAHGPTIDRAAAVTTDLGSLYGVAGVATSLTAGGRRSAAVDVAASGLTAWTVAQGIKPLLHRPRPYETGEANRLVAVPAGSSWPSGHAAVMAAMTVALAPELSARARIAAVTATAVVGLSRLHVGVHHASDVVAGAGVGTLAGLAWRVVRRRWRSAGSP